MQEFMAHKLKVQMGQAGGGGDSINNGSHYWPVRAEHHMMPHSSAQVPEISCRAASNGPPRSMFPLSKNGVGGAKRGFSEALGNTVPPPPMESRNGGSPLYGSDGSRNNGFVEGGGGALLEIIREEVIMRCLLSNPSIILEHLHLLLLLPLPPCTLATTTQGLHLPPGSRVWSHLVGYLVLSVLNGLLHKGEGSHYHHHHHHHRR
jgi:hypothetical protein